MSEIVFPTYSNPLDVSSPFAENNPLGKESTFYTPKVVVSNSYDSSSSNLGDINCHFVYFQSGFDVIERYNLLKNKLNTEDEYRESIGLVDANSLNILYEDHTEVTGKSNLFGTSCRVLMGKKTAKFIQGIIESKASFFLNDVLFDFYNLSKFVEEIVEQENKKNPNLQSKINATIVEAAILIEYHKVKEKNFFEEIIEGLTTGLRDKLVELIFDASDELESFKFTSANYEPSNPNFSPVIPVKITKKILEGGLKKLIEAGDSFGNFIIAIADLLGTVFPVFKIISEQLDLLFKLLRQFADKIIKAIEKGLLWANAFLCGLCNGFISLLQSVLVLAGFVFKIQPIGTGVPTSPAKLAAKLSEYQIWAEFAEDTVEAFIDSIPKILNGIVNSIEYVVTHLEEVFSKISDFVGKGIDIAQKGVKKAFNSLANKTPYWWAFIAGAFVFEVIVEIILLLLTGGTAAVAKEVARISRAIKKTGKTVAKAAAKTVDVATTALRAIKKLFDEMLDAVNNGRFIEWVKGKLDELLGIEKKQDINNGDNNLNENISDIDLSSKKTKKANVFTKIRYGTGISKKALEYRKALHSPFHKGNICVIEFKNIKTGMLETKIFSTQKKSNKHAENIALQWLDDNKISPNDVTSFYSELEPCALGKHKCKQLIIDTFSGLNAQYSFEYPGTGHHTDSPVDIMTRRRAVNKRFQLLVKLFIKNTKKK